MWTVSLAITFTHSLISLTALIGLVQCRDPWPVFCPSSFLLFSRLERQTWRCLRVSRLQVWSVWVSSTWHQGTGQLGLTVVQYCHTHIFTSLAVLDIDCSLYDQYCVMYACPFSSVLLAVYTLVLLLTMQ